MSTTLTMPTPKAQSETEILKAALARMQAENDKLKAENAKKANGSLSLKVSEKGAVSLIGMGRFPVTLYKQQWLRMLDYAVQIRAFIEANDSKLAVKGQPKPVPAPVAPAPDYAAIYAELEALKAKAAKA